MKYMHFHNRNGFTLIEIAIVLVIIGLILGGILLGTTLISSAGIRAQISQIDQYQSAVSEFQAKYDCLPGDCLTAHNGAPARGSSPGQGDGNGVIEGYDTNGNASDGRSQGTGETAVFWVDLSMAKLIPESFSVASETTRPYASAGNIYGIPALEQYLPKAKLDGDHIYVYSIFRTNYFGISNAGSIAADSMLDGNSPDGSSTNMTVAEAYNIDKKIDDGLPQSGNVTTRYVGGNQDYVFWPYDPAWGIAGQAQWYWAGDINYYPDTSGGGIPATHGGCYDNNGTANTPLHYTMSVNNGLGANCALSFKFQ